MDQRTSALEAATGGSATATGEMALAAVAASTQGVVQTEEPNAASASPAPTLPQAAQASPAEQIKVQLTKGMKDGSDSINVLLHPEDLGTVEVKLLMQDGQVKATISASNPETLQLLKNDAQQLQQSLQNAGFNTDSNALSFQLRGDQQNSSAFAQQQQNNGQNSPANTTGSEAAATLASDDGSASLARSTVTLQGGLDIQV
jgi:flagellar hook-length control protein FliK